MAGGRRRSRKMRGGNGYGVGAPIAVGALEYVPNMTSVPDGAAYKPLGGRRSRRRSRKTRRRRGGYEVSAPPDPDMVTKDQCKSPDTWKPTKARTASGEVLGYCNSASGFQYPRKGKHSGGRRTRRRMRGGGSVAGVGYGFAGDGARGLAIQQAYPSNLPVGGAFAIPTGTR